MKHTHKMEMKKSDLYLWKKWLPHTWLPRSHLKCWSVSLRRFIRLPLRWTAFLWISGPSRLKRNRLAYVDSVISMTSYGHGLFGPEWVGGGVQDDWQNFMKTVPSFVPQLLSQAGSWQLPTEAVPLFPFPNILLSMVSIPDWKAKKRPQKKKKGTAFWNRHDWTKDNIPGI